MESITYPSGLSARGRQEACNAEGARKWCRFRVSRGAMHVAMLTTPDVQVLIPMSSLIAMTPVLLCGSDIARFMVRCRRIVQDENESISKHL